MVIVEEIFIVGQSIKKMNILYHQVINQCNFGKQNDKDNSRLIWKFKFSERKMIFIWLVYHGRIMTYKEKIQLGRPFCSHRGT